MKKYYYEYERVSAYCYPDSWVLRNRLNIQEADALNFAEREITSARMQEALEFPLRGRFDLKHLQKLHEFIFREVYAWAGELRTINIAKGNQFCNYEYLEQYAAGIFDELKAEKYLAKVPSAQIPARLAYYLGEINVLHPFREGNGRAQRVFIAYLAQAAGYSITFEDVPADEMIEASALAFAKDYAPMKQMFERIVSPISAEEQRAFRIKMGLSRPRKRA
ncbi:MAG: Fic family protein [Oscillospiraceae bacterium]|jgi:cell filamentation protein|nr:Fic family protein [Oscillospiraceae bacterium]